MAGLRAGPASAELPHTVTGVSTVTWMWFPDSTPGECAVPPPAPASAYATPPPAPSAPDAAAATTAHVFRLCRILVLLGSQCVRPGRPRHAHDRAAGSTYAAPAARGHKR